MRRDEQRLACSDVYIDARLEIIVILIAELSTKVVSPALEGGGGDDLIVPYNDCAAIIISKKTGRDRHGDQWGHDAVF